MSSTKGKYPQDEYAKDLRQLQASKLAFRSVAEGIEHFKEGRHTEAFQCLNKALQIDPRNVEGLVARGALYANSGSFAKAIVDFEAALKLNGSHANAKKYLGETLLALGRNYEEDSKFEEARKAYIDCLKINPHHQEALASLEYLKTKLNSKKIVEPAELELPPLNIGSIPLLKESKSSRDFGEIPTKLKDDSRKKAKKDKKKKGKKRQSSSSESSSDSSDSSESSSESTDDSSSSDSDSNSRSKKKNKKRLEKSLSPLSKRMDLTNSSYQFNQSFGSNTDDHEIKVRKFLEMGRDEDDYEDRVRQLMAETSKYQKSKQAEEAKASKKKKKSEKKMKKEKKKRKKEEKKKSKGNEIENLREALKMFENLPEFSKFQKIYNDKIKEEELKLKHAENDREAPEKWKMKFAKDERQIDTKSKIPGKFGFNYEFDEEDQTRSFQSQPATQSSYTATSGLYETKIKQRSPQPKPKVEVAPVAPVPIVSKGPVVLDKFGNFRLADPGGAIIPPRPLEPTSSTRRSRSRSRRRSRSRSNSRRRSGSYRRRYSRSRSFSRSYSRSRSRSRGRRGFRSRGNFTNRQRFSPKRNQPQGRGRWNDNYRDSRDFRNNRGTERFNRDRPRGRFERFNRSMSRSAERSPVRPEGSQDRRENERRERDGDRRREDPRWTEHDSVGKPDLVEMEEMMKKTRKDKIEDNGKEATKERTGF